LIDIRRDDERLGMGYEFERAKSALVGTAEHTWTERVQIIHSDAAAESQTAALQRRLERADAAVRGLTPPPGPGRTQFTTGWELEKAIAAILTEHDVAGLLQVRFERQETSQTKFVGRGRRGPNRPKKTEWNIRYQITAVQRNADAGAAGVDAVRGLGTARSGSER
jgi:hypothetical protein